MRIDKNLSGEDTKAHYKPVIIKSIWDWHRDWKILTDGIK